MNDSPAEVVTFESALRSIGRDAERCATHVYTFQTFNHIVGTQPELLDIINRNPSFWIGSMHAQLSAGFTALHRLYETEPDHLSLASLLNLAQVNLHLFSRSSLSLRKRLQGLSVDAAAEFVSDSCEADVMVFAEVRSAVAEGRRLYDETARQIRHWYFAHTNLLKHQKIEELFLQLPARDFERLAVLPLRVHSAIWRYYVDGYRPQLVDAPHNIGDVMNALPRKYTGTWHHLHVAADTAAFLESLSNA